MNRLPNNERGQMTIEALLLITVFLAVALTVQNRAMSQGWLKNLVEAPWTRIQGMIEDGVWLNPKVAIQYHPNMKSRHGSLLGEKAP